MTSFRQQLPAHAEGAEELVVQVVPVGNDNEGGVLHCRMLDDLSGIEGHEQALPRALRVPDHPTLRSPPGLVASRVRSTACRTAWN